MDEAVIHYYEGNSETFPGIQVTIKSLREVYSGKIIFLYKNISNSLISFLKEQNIELVSCDKYKVIFNTSPYNNKIIYTYLFLRDQKQFNDKTKILFCDVGDVYFTSSPFNINNDKLLFSLETDTIEKCTVNRTWLNICYGKKITNEIKQNIVVNSGVILGTVSKIKHLFKCMVDDMATILTKVNYPITDQAIVNKLVYYDNIECALESQRISNFSQNPNLELTNIINHQYKVNQEYTKILYDKYCK
jgi:hypothetical protein